MLFSFFVSLLDLSMDLRVRLCWIILLLCVLFHEGGFVRYHFVKRYPAERNLRVWKNMHAVELVRSGRLLTDWQELNPGHSFDLFDDFRHVVPVEG